ncbi:hypothetical protein ElyMa_006778800 [Elysia marginata]|uniref:Uncharacterized protein n=1 Tax=Elysia marginata TaxID=1093978 RepID=A0AAV4IZ90_9GAST|nr:hypothetical protein ElyMa_006778800 [Elysia marginata]
MKLVIGLPRCGGDIMKTAEAAQWILLYPKSVAFLGSSGGDMHLEEITYCMQEMHVAYKLETKIKNTTSLQLILRHGKRWSEIYMFDPNATSLTLQFIDRPRVITLLERAELIFISVAGLGLPAAH